MSEVKRNIPGYVTIPGALFVNKELSQQEKLALALILTLSNTQRKSWASNGYFAEMLDISERTFQRILSSLEEKGYITRDVIRDKETNQVVKRYITPVKFVGTPHDTDDTTPHDTDDTYNKQVENKQDIKKKNIKKKIETEGESILLTDAEKDRLIADYGEKTFQAYADKLGLYLESTGKRYKSHNATIRQWINRDGIEKRPKPVKKEEFQWEEVPEDMLPSAMMKKKRLEYRDVEV